MAIRMTSTTSPEFADLDQDAGAWRISFLPAPADGGWSTGEATAALIYAELIARGDHDSPRAARIRARLQARL